jgi:hypothetical protein
LHNAPRAALPDEIQVYGADINAIVSGRSHEPAWLARRGRVFIRCVGRGLSNAADKWTLKWIFEVPPP